MSKFYLLLSFLFACTFFNAQSQDVSQLQETAKSFTRQGDYTNAILVLNRAYQQEPSNLDIGKDLALNYYFQRDYARAKEIIDLLLDKDEVDDQVYQVAGNIYKSLDLPKECEKIYKKGIKKFRKSGGLYNDYGELLWSQGNIEAIRQWEKGIELDPNFAGNYYNASRYYYFSFDKVWTVIYGEVFINMESLTGRTVEMKGILLEAYKKLFMEQDLLNNNNKQKNAFIAAVLTSMNKQSNIASSGINPETLTMIRTRFILDWAETGAKKFPVRLFEYHKQLLQEGMFNAYNQWLFGIPQNLVAYQRWTSTHTDEYNEFNNFQKGRIFKIPEGQFYQVSK